MTDNRLSVDLDKILREPNDNSPTRRIYANRTLDMSTEVIGFDMDYTLGPYHQENGPTCDYDNVGKVGGRGVS